jgi:hypothetical protein
MAKPTLETEAQMARARQTERFVSVLKSPTLPFPKLQEASPITIKDEEGNNRRGNYFVSMCKELQDSLPDTYLSVNRFLEEIGKDPAEKERVLLGQSTGSTENPIFNMSQKGFELNIYNGANCESAVALTHIAHAAFNAEEGKFNFTNEQRKQYQQSEINIIKPALSKPFIDTHGYRIFEDCIASGDSIAGLIHLLSEKNKIDAHSTIRIDAVLGTTQGILILKKYAEMMEINLEINVGYLATGLTRGEEGKGKSKKHANYMTYVSEYKDRLEELGLTEELARIKDYSFTVGDMGDAAFQYDTSSTSEIPGDADKVNVINPLTGNSSFDSSRELDILANTLPGEHPTNIYLARGGCFMKAIDDILNEGVSKETHNSVGIRASRIWSSEESIGYGVLFVASSPEDYFDKDEN